MRILALDYGHKRIGVALSDPTGSLASPITTIRGDTGDLGIENVLRLVAEHSANEIVVGLPLSLSGDVGSQAAKIIHFVQALSERCDIPIKTLDERLSTVQAERLLKDSGVKPSKDRPRVDSAAAAVILQAYLDTQILEQKGHNMCDST